MCAGSGCCSVLQPPAGFVAVGFSADSGGFPPETASIGATKIAGPSFPFETLLSPVIADDMQEEAREFGYYFAK
uniref:Uncharacterized protein n=1 Tax=Fagus sylvatica TaxID=28930 RepID=A0A2N9IEF9_FAGSY